MKNLFHSLEKECLNFLSSQTVSAENLYSLIGEFLHNQPEHVLLILAKEAQHDDAISDTLAQSKSYQSNILIERAIRHLNDILYKSSKPIICKENVNLNKMKTGK